MTMIYSNPARESEGGALPDVEVFYVATSTYGTELCPQCMNGSSEGADPLTSPFTEREHITDHTGFYWQSCFPGCLPDGEPNGPFDTEAEATYDAQFDAMGEPGDDDEPLPPCVLAMRCYCAGHARGNPASAPCDTNENAEVKP